MEALLAACRDAGIEAVISEDITVDIWSKFAFLAALSGMTALVRAPKFKLSTSATHSKREL